MDEDAAKGVANKIVGGGCLLFLLGAAFLSAIFVWAWIQPHVPGTTAKIEEIAAYSMCQDFVLQRLKAPSTAKFPLWHEEPQVKTTDGKRYVVRSYVDAQNSFGAQIRADYVCEVESVGDDKWRLNRLQLGGA